MPRFLALLLVAASLNACSSPDPPGSVTTPSHPGGENRTVRFASTDGRFVGLDDGSLWNIDWRHAGTAAGWKPGEPVRVTRARETDFPHQLTDRAGKHAGARHGRRLD